MSINSNKISYAAVVDIFFEKLSAYGTLNLIKTVLHKITNNYNAKG